MEDKNTAVEKAGQKLLQQWEKPAVKSEYNIAELTKTMGPGAGDGFVYS